MTRFPGPLTARPAALVLALCVATACGQKDALDSTDTSDTSATGTTPVVTSSTPSDGTVGVALNTQATATFSEDMDPETLDGTTFTLTLGSTGAAIAGSVVYSDRTAAFWPATHLAAGTAFTAVVSTGARSASGVALADDHGWSFTTGTALAPGLPIRLRRAGDFVILAKSAVSTVPISAVTGDVGLSPAAATYFTGFSLTADATDAFSTSTQVTGRLFAADDATPTPANLTTAVGDMEIAFTDAAARTPDVTELGAGNLGGSTLTTGVYKWGTGVTIPTDLTLHGTATDVWVLQIAGDLTLASGTRVELTGGAVPENVFWQVSGEVVLGTTAHLQGIVLSQTAITLDTGASVTGRLFAQTAVHLDQSTVVAPAR